VLFPQLSKDLETVVLTALQKNPTQRYASAAFFQADLQGLLSTASGTTNEKPRTAPPETRFDIRSTGFIIDAQPGSQTRMASERARPASLANTHSDAFRPTSQADLADLTGDDQSNTDLPGAWQRYRLWIVVVSVLLVTASVIISLLLLRHDVPIAPVASVPETGTLP
jgi:hypothetical protein